MSVLTVGLNVLRAVPAKVNSSTLSKVGQNLGNGADTLTLVGREFCDKADDLGLVKKRVQNCIANGRLEKVLGDNATLRSAEETLRKERIDNLFNGAPIKRVKGTYNFLPTQWPSGDSFSLKKEVGNLLGQGQKHFEYTKNGDIIQGSVSGLDKKRGENCFTTTIKRLKNGDPKVAETVAMRYYPQSDEINIINRGMDGTKTFTKVLGSPDSCKVIEKQVK